MATPTVRLRPFEESDLDWYRAMVNDPGSVGVHNWGGARSEAQIRAVLEPDPTGRSGNLVCELVDGTAIGDVAWRPRRWGPTERSWCPSIGIALLPEHRGRGYGTAAQRSLASHLFEQLDVERVEADTAVDNLAEQGALERAGFTREGLVRRCEWRDGRWHDHVLYSVVREDWVAGAAE